ncbi:Ger(x)C family spore germination protein [Filobacillus milosensis]|uniref:Ger(X)C family spore germination protein n=1 Tax=Filobacillus milosensis TaxID=94137 RepID=A0A4Y8IEV9_9BACI|nr:Ger(x)C family spore germination protein [Filobacillus milosensis]TFB15084.1 Ger(x)C family spore germination protein [Filobacillus milosensis]
MIKKWISLLLILLLLTGCLKKNILDDVRLVTAIGYDPINTEELKITTVVPLFRSDQSTSSETHTDIANITTEGNKKMDNMSSKPFVKGKLEVILYNKKLAEKGLLPIIDLLVRDPSIGTRAFLAISDEEVNQLLSGQYSSQDNGMYIADMINQNIELGLTPKMNLHLWLNGFYAEGSDPYAPIINTYNQNVKITGIALFKDDKMVSDLPSDSLFTFKTLVQPKTKRGIFTAELDNKEVVAIYKVNGKRTIKVKNIEQSPTIKVDIKLYGIIKEFSGEVVNDKIMHQIEKSIEDKIKTQASEMISQFQELNIDPVGFGEEIRSKSRSWNQQQWNDKYPDCEITVNVDVTITETGIVN